jgi:Xaa-Pro aminopeptidase
MRLARLRDTLPALGVDALLVTQPENRRYLSGFTGSAGWLIVSPDRAVLLTDSRYWEQVGREAPDWELARLTGVPFPVLAEQLQAAGAGRVGLESQHVTVDLLANLGKELPGVEWVPLKDTVEALRAVKDEAEIAAVRRAVALTDEALAHALAGLRPGMTEGEVAWAIESYMRTHGASAVAFEPIVASGPNGALPHARPSDRPIQAGEPVVFDIGCVVDGYCSDLTRTVSLGRPSDRVLEVWEIVFQAQQAAEAAICPGLAGKDADAAARAVIEAAGYGEQFGHGLGHGVGLVVHEKPGAGRLSTDVLAAGNLVTVEPGIYLPGEFGVRIEDLVLVTEDGVEILSQSPKEPYLLA